MDNAHKNWNKLYAKGRRGKYPNEMLIRFINSKFGDLNRGKIKILDLGFGTGRHLVYFAQEGFNTCGIESSLNGAKVADKWLKEKGLNAAITIGSFVKIDTDNNEFDAVVDVASIQHNNYADIKKIINEVYRVIKPGGYAFSYLKTKYDSLYKQSRSLDNRTHIISATTEKADTSSVICFLSKNDIIKLFSLFLKVNIEKEEWTYNNMKQKVSHWVVTAQK
jgi:ubiquinone/menaquinone biosynthesis C-methylase UbiE